MGTVVHMPMSVEEAAEYMTALGTLTDLGQGQRARLIEFWRTTFWRLCPDHLDPKNLRAIAIQIQNLADEWGGEEQ